jgi:hypothetical protein
MQKNCTFSNILQKVKSYFFLRLIPSEIPKKYKIEAPYCIIYNRIRILLVNCLQEELDQPDLRPQGEIEEELVRRDREAPLGKGCFVPGTYRVRNTVVVKKFSFHSTSLPIFDLGCNLQHIIHKIVRYFLNKQLKICPQSRLTFPVL